MCVCMCRRPLLESLKELIAIKTCPKLLQSIVSFNKDNQLESSVVVYLQKHAGASHDNKNINHTCFSILTELALCINRMAELASYKAVVPLITQYVMIFMYSV